MVYNKVRKNSYRNSTLLCPLLVLNKCTVRTYMSIIKKNVNGRNLSESMFYLSLLITYIKIYNNKVSVDNGLYYFFKVYVT